MYNKHLAFKINYGNFAKELITDVYVSSIIKDNKAIRCSAVWDTGATHTAVSKKLFNSLNLPIISSAKVIGVNSVADNVPVVLLNIVLPNSILLENLRATVCDIGGDNADVLIGMDIIRFGDFSISNKDNITHFTFVMPPLANRIDLLYEASKINKNIKE